MVGRIVLILAGMAGLWIGAVHAEQRPISSVREAAIKRMQARLGTMRGSISPSDSNVLLTERMIELLRPVKSRKDTVIIRDSSTLEELSKS